MYVEYKNKCYSDISDCIHKKHRSIEKNARLLLF